MLVRNLSLSLGMVKSSAKLTLKTLWKNGVSPSAMSNDLF